MPGFLALRGMHIACVAASGSLFTLRGVATLRQAAWPLHRRVRYASYAIDTALLASGVALAIRTHQSPLVVPWLAAKLGWLVVYIVLGSLALKRAPTLRLRAASLAGAFGVLLLIISVAITRQPLGFLGVLRRP